MQYPVAKVNWCVPIYPIQECNAFDECLPASDMLELATLNEITSLRLISLSPMISRSTQVWTETVKQQPGNEFVTDDDL